MTENSNAHLTSGRLLARNTVWNLAGQVLPVVVALVSIPLIVRGIGVERFGVLSLAWIVIGYMSLFDLGIGRALTKLVADRLGANEDHSIAPLAWTLLLLMFVLGVFGAFGTAAISPLLVHRLLKIPEALQPETLQGFYFLAASIPIVITTAGLRGILEALQRFRVVNLIRIPMSVFSFAGPLLVLPFSHSLVPVIVVLIAGRLVGCIVHLFACFYAMPALRRNFALDASQIAPALRLGGWMTASNVVGPIMSYLDRFMIGALLSVTAVSYYAVPADVIGRILVIPVALAGVLFPAFAVSLLQDSASAGRLFSRGVKYMFLAIFPIVLIVAALAPEGLQIWLGPAFAQNGAPALRWLAAGTLLNCLAFVPFAMVQASGRPDITGKLHLAELPFYVATLWFMLKFRGIEGAAMAWTARVSVDAALLFGFADRLLPKGMRLAPRVAGGVVAGLSLMCFAVLLDVFWIRVLYVSVVLIACGLTGWFWLLTPPERGVLLRLVPISGAAEAAAESSQGARPAEAVRTSQV
jgi:O-antigen/teichoic acid export membrane protein